MQFSSSGKDFSCSGKDLASIKITRNVHKSVPGKLKLIPGETFGIAVYPRHHRKHRIGLPPETQFAPKPRGHGVEHGQESGLLTVDLSPEHDKGSILGVCVAPDQVAIPAQSRGLCDKDTARARVGGDGGLTFLDTFRNRNVEVLPNQELGNRNLNIPLRWLLCGSRTRHHLPAQGERKKQKNHWPFKRARRSHAVHLAQSLRPSKPA